MKAKANFLLIKTKQNNFSIVYCDIFVVTFSFGSGEKCSFFLLLFFFDYTACFHNLDHLEAIPGTSSV